MLNLVFLATEPGGRAAPERDAAVVVLERDNWDDFGYKTYFHVRILLDFGHTVELGAVKIMFAGQTDGKTPMPTGPFESLDPAYCSLGQDVAYYEMVDSLDADMRDQYLRSMRDAAFDPSIQARFASEDGWTTSLLRFGQASNALEAGASVLRGDGTMRGSMSFAVRDPIGPSSSAPIEFNFHDDGQLPGRTHVVIGYNGAGKTHLLARLALAASRVASTGENLDASAATIEGRDATFGAVVAVSYSAFDTFATPGRLFLAQAGQRDNSAKTEFFGYVYCGLRSSSRMTEDEFGAQDRRDELKSIQDVEEEFVQALTEASSKADGRPLREALELLSVEPSFGRIGVTPSDWVDSADRAASEVSRLSTGHKIVLNIVVQLAAHLKTRSLVLIDEPESHLHPPLLAALLKAIHALLAAHDSFAIVATHSPVVLQETPSQYVRVLERHGDETSLRGTDIETFGENIGAITRHVFSLDSSASDYQGVLVQLLASMPLEQVEGLFPHGMSAQARALATNAQRRISGSW